MQTKEELAKEINDEIVKIKSEIRSSFSSNDDATNRVAISNLYIALSNLTK